MPGEDLAALAARQIKERVKGAKIDLVAEQVRIRRHDFVLSWAALTVKGHA